MHTLTTKNGQIYADQAPGPAQSREEEIEMTPSCSKYKILLVREKTDRIWKTEAVSEPGDLENMLGPYFRNLDREHFVVVALNAKNIPIGWSTISIGCLNATLVHPREVFKFALLSSAASIILTHNHPSGDPSPSTDDISLTVKLVKAGEIMGISVLDHLIFGDTLFSLSTSGLM